MKNQGFTFNYLLSWIMLGLVAGLIFLIFKGYEHLNLIDSENADTAVVQQVEIASGRVTGFAHAVSQATSSVVSIQASRIVAAQPTSGDLLLERFLGKDSPHAPNVKTTSSSGSGVILDSRGYILTNYHVIKEADAIQITLNDGRTTQAELVGNDPETDLAVLKISLEKLPQAKIADISKLRIGDIALAIGYPYEIGQTVTQGIISATGRTQVSDNTYENFLQTDAAINPGNSGGALVNVDGEIVGINSLIFTGTGGYQSIGFAIPIDLAKTVLEQIATNGYVVRGWLGVGGQDLSPQMLKKIGLEAVQGVLVTDVDKKGPGDDAGLIPGDIITHINGQNIVSIQDILNVVAAGQPGDIFKISGLRERQSFKIEATLGQRPIMSQE